MNKINNRNGDAGGIYNNKTFIAGDKEMRARARTWTRRSKARARARGRA